MIIDVADAPWPSSTSDGFESCGSLNHSGCGRPERAEDLVDRARRRVEQEDERETRRPPADQRRQVEHRAEDAEPGLQPDGERRDHGEAKSMRAGTRIATSHSVLYAPSPLGSLVAMNT